MTTPHPDLVSYWTTSSGETDYPPLPHDAGAPVDVAVVGGGIAGLCTAWELARAGRTVAVVEAARIAAGVTGNTTAKVSALHSLTYARLRSKQGREAARAYARSQQDAVEHVVRVTEELRIDCDLERTAACTYTESDAALDSIRAEAEAAREAGLPASFTKETDLPFPVAGAVVVEDQAQFHPRRYLLALAEDLVRLGGRVYEGTRVVGLREGDPCRLTTESRATLRARHVVVATHYPVFDRAMMFARMEPHRELVVAGLLSAEQTPKGMYITPDGTTRSVRSAPQPDGRRLLIVTGEKFRPGTVRVGERFDRLAAWARERFPGIAIEFRWAAQDNDTSDSVPFVGPFHPGTRNVHVATGFGGWGMTGGVMAGRLLAAHITGGGPLPWSSLYDPRRLHPLREGPSLLTAQASVARHFVGDRLRPDGHPKDVESIPPGSGAVVREGMRHHAVHRDDDGRVHAVSARCTHLGCLVRFNDAERTWDCPCHGSRFAVDGSVVQGPAVRPLEARQAPGTAANGSGSDSGDGLRDREHHRHGRHRTA